MFKKILSSVIVFGLIVGGVGVWQAMGKEAKNTEQGTKSKTEELKNKKTEEENKRLKPKLQRQVGTPTVQQLLDKVETNYHKIQDLKADWTYKIRNKKLTEFLGILGDLFIQKEKFFFKAPNKLKWIPPNQLLTLVKKNNIEYRRMGEGFHAELTKDTPVRPTKLPWYTLLDPGRFDFYWRLDEIITKFDSRVIAHPETNIWVIEAVPKATNPEDNHNYPTGAKIEIFIDYEKGVITKINCIDHEWSKEMGKIIITEQTEIKNFTLINNIWIPTTLIVIHPSLPKYRPEESKEEYTLSNIQINTGIADSEFEF